MGAPDSAGDGAVAGAGASGQAGAGASGQAGAGASGRGRRRGREPVAGEGAYRGLIRAGFISRGITYAIIGGLTLAMAFGAGTGGTAPDQEGALALISHELLGRIVLIAIAAGLLGYALWKFEQAWLGIGPEGGGDDGAFDRVANVSGGISYLAFFALAVRTLMGSGGDDASAPRQAAAGVLGWPGGPAIVGVVGLIVIGVSLYQAHDACRAKFMGECHIDQMSPVARHGLCRLGQVGLIARSAVFALVGYFLLITAIEFNPRQAVGLDGALYRLHHQDFGPWIAGLAALGLLTFAAFSLVESRYRRL